MRVILYGSGEFTNLVTDIDKYLIKHYKLKNIAVIPTAAGKEQDFHKWLDMAVSHYKGLGIKVTEVPILNKQDANNDHLVNLLNEADWIFFSGGNPKYLYTTLVNSKLWEKVMDRVSEGALLAGSSAGAMIMGNYILTNPLKALFMQKPAIWEKAFGIVRYTVIPHYDRVKNHKKVLLKIIEKSPVDVKNSWIGIEENTALIIDGQRIATKGIGTVEFNQQ